MTCGAPAAAVSCQLRGEHGSREPVAWSLVHRGDRTLLCVPPDRRPHRAVEKGRENVIQIAAKRAKLKASGDA